MGRHMQGAAFLLFSCMHCPAFCLAAHLCSATDKHACSILLLLGRADASQFLFVLGKDDLITAFISTTFRRLHAMPSRAMFSAFCNVWNKAVLCVHPGGPHAIAQSQKVQSTA